MQNFRKKVRSLVETIPAVKIAACMLSVAMAAVIFWGFTLTGKFLGSTKEFLKIEKETVTKEEVIAHSVEERKTSLLKPGKKKVIQAGADGKKMVTYEQNL